MLFWLLTQTIFMMTSSNGNIFCITGSLWGESAGYHPDPNGMLNLWWKLWTASGSISCVDCWRCFTDGPKVKWYVMVLSGIMVHTPNCWKWFVICHDLSKQPIKIMSSDQRKIFKVIKSQEQFEKYYVQVCSQHYVCRWPKTTSDSTFNDAIKAPIQYRDVILPV